MPSNGTGCNYGRANRAISLATLALMVVAVTCTGWAAHAASKAVVAAGACVTSHEQRVEPRIVTIETRTSQNALALARYEERLVRIQEGVDRLTKQMDMMAQRSSRTPTRGG